MVATEAIHHDHCATDETPPSLQSRSSMLYQEEREWAQAMEKTKPKGLLDLPIDVLQHVMSHTTHTNDLCALALTHPSLHRLVVPYIYSRFDIVWPEANPTVDSRVGVDALTYGLATLVMAHDVLGEASHQQQCSLCQLCDEHRPAPTCLQPRTLPIRIRRGNYFAHFTRKFSLGNGPTDWVSEYLITKEGGKMLGTLVALALGRMKNLEAFVWDMPTGVLRDVWIALGSLATRHDGQNCRLEKIWVRWHDNRDASHLPPGPMPHAVPSLLQGSASSLFQIPAYPTVEFPTFSILPGLKSISVLDIDEVPYAEELGVLIERSLDKLQELRIGVAVHAQRNLPFRPIDDRSVVPPPFLTSENAVKPGGMLGILFGQLNGPYDTTPLVPAARTVLQPPSDPQTLFKEDSRSTSLPAALVTAEQIPHADVDLLGAMLSTQKLQDDSEGVPPGLSHLSPTPSINVHAPRLRHPHEQKTVQNESREHYRRKLKLSVLELERVYLSIPVLSRSVDWSRIESLTLLGCMNHEELWKALRRTFTPSTVRNRTPSSRLASAVSRHRSSNSMTSLSDPTEYKLKIRRLHTDTVSKALLEFIKNTLAPDTLEWLFLQQSTTYRSTVEIDDIYKFAIRRHKGSLRKLLIDSELKNLPRHERDREREDDSNWKKWAFHQELITCITSGKMLLRELSMAITHDGWHYFLKRLPNVTSLRSLHIPHVANHPFGRSYDREEIARSILNIVAVRPEIELCYFGIEKKCYEILQYDSTTPRHTLANSNHADIIAITTHTTIEEEEDDDVDHDDGGAAHHMNHFAAPELSEEEDNHGSDSNASSKVDDTDDEEEEEDDDDDRGRMRNTEFTLREILFYDDKISIFKARHGKL